MVLATLGPLFYLTNGDSINFSPCYGKKMARLLFPKCLRGWVPPHAKGCSMIGPCKQCFEDHQHAANIDLWTSFWFSLPSLSRFAYSQEPTMNQRRSHTGPASAKQPDCNCWPFLQRQQPWLRFRVDFSMLGPCKSIVGDSTQNYLSRYNLKKPPRCSYGLWWLWCR